MLLLEKIADLDIVLASQSPRRKELLTAAGIPFREWVIPVDESFPDNLPPVEVALYLCRQKAQAFDGKIEDKTIIITADTIVVKDYQILNKASDATEARKMLKMLSGSQHEVITGICLTTTHHQRCFYDITRVFFDPLSEQEIDYYIKNYKPFDKAGAYGIQEWVGMSAVSRIEGCYYNVVGLPVASLYRELNTFICKQFHSKTF